MRKNAASGRLPGVFDTKVTGTAHRLFKIEGKKTLARTPFIGIAFICPFGDLSERLGE